MLLEKKQNPKVDPLFIYHFLEQPLFFGVEIRQQQVTHKSHMQSYFRLLLVKN